MALDITKIIFRQGTEEQRRIGGGTGVLFHSAEPAYCVDTRRLYIGTGITPGGVPVGMRNLGIVNQLFGTFGNGFSQQAYEVMTASAAEVGDIIYDRSTRLLYALTGKNTFPPTSGNFVPYDFTVRIDPAVLTFNTINEITFQNEGITPQYLNGGVAGTGLRKLSALAPIEIAPYGVTNTMLRRAPGNSIKGNSFNGVSDVEDILVGPRMVVGKNSTSPLTAIPFSDILSEAEVRGANGIAITRIGASNTVSLSATHFNVRPGSINFLQPTVINNTLSATQTFTTSGAVICNGLTTTASINAGTNSLTCGNVTCRNIDATGYQLDIGAIVGSGNIRGASFNVGGTTVIDNARAFVGTSLNVGTGTINSGPIISTGNITCSGLIVNTTTVVDNSLNIVGSSLNVGNGAINCGTVDATGDITAFASDKRLKENILPIENALEKINNIQGFIYTFNDKAQSFGFNKDVKRVGMYAQEVDKVLPEAVKLAPFDTMHDGDKITSKSGEFYLTVQYEKLVPLLIEGIKELQAEVTILKNEIQQLRN